jgi:hypothetical protein
VQAPADAATRVAFPDILPGTVQTPQPSVAVELVRLVAVLVAGADLLVVPGLPHATSAVVQTTLLVIAKQLQSR